MKRLRLDKHLIQSNNAAVDGVGYDIKFFPDSRPGKGGPFSDTMKKPAKGDPFDDWVDYFVNFIGAKLEKLNGLQFDLDKKGNAKKAMADELEELATELKVGGTTAGPSQLLWPLSGPYTFSWGQVDAKSIGFATFIIDLFFKNENKYRMVVNCSVEITAHDLQPAQPISSNSSYLMTSSSG